MLKHPLLIILLLTAAELYSANVIRGPYLQLPTPSSMVLRWRTDVSMTGRVRYGAAPGALSAFADEGSSLTDHLLTLSALSADTLYYYSVGDSGAELSGNDAATSLKTAPTPGSSARPYRFWVLGDAGTGNANQMAVRDRYYALSASSGVATDLWLQLGDNAYFSGTDAEYQTEQFVPYASFYRHVASMPCIGNHEATCVDYLNIFSLPSQGEMGGVISGTERYFSYDYGNVHFVVLDSHSSDRSPAAPMLTWLKNDLSANAQPWTIAYWHHPPYSKGSHDSDADPQLTEVRQNFLPILESYGVDLVLCGHSHSYERSRFISGHYGVSGTFNILPQSQGGNLVQDGNGPYVKANGPGTGTIYLVSGGGGQTSGGALNHYAHRVSLNVLGSVVLDVDGSTLTARMLDAAGAIRDNFQIVKGVPAPITYTVTLPAPQPHWAPAPAHAGQAWCLGGDPFLEASVKLYTLSGELVGQATVRPGACYTLGDLAPGIYMARSAIKNFQGRAFERIEKIAVLP
jgi:hypothetical protein